MKHIIFILLSAIISFSSNAQQALGTFIKSVSPIINDDKTVTFIFNAPKAVKVQITGDFLPTQKITEDGAEKEIAGIADFAENENGIWEYTTPTPLSPELYSYSIIVDGLKVNDPSNVYQLRDVVTINNIFIVPGNHADLYLVNKVPHGTLLQQWYHSKTLGTDRRLTVYTPAGYETSWKRYPVLYLHHGMGGDENAWIELGRAVQILDNLIAANKVEPMIVVMPNGNSSQESTPGFNSDNLAQPSFYLPNTPGDYELHFPEIVEFIDKNYRTKATKKYRAIAGLSMGGLHSLHISKQYPDMFDYIGLFSAAIMPFDSNNSEIYTNFDKKLDTQFEKKPKLYWIAIGKDDFLYDMNVEYRKKFDEKGYPYTYYESEGGHIWRNWRIYLSQFTQLLFK